MEKLIIQQTTDTPKVELDPDKGKIEIAGWSIPEYSDQFYQPIIAWIDEYCKKTQQKTTATLFLNYYNTSSARYILQILRKLDELYKKGNDVKIQWQFEEDDEDTMESGEDFSKLLSLPFEIVKSKS